MRIFMLILNSGKGEKGLREAAYLNLTAASSIGKPAL